MLPECIPQTGQVLPNYPDRRLRRIRIITEIIPVAQKSKIKMNPADRNNPCVEKEQDRDESGRPK